MKTLLLYATKYGSTKTCVEYLLPKLQGEVTAVQYSTKTPIMIEDYDAVIIGSPIYMGKIPKQLADFAENYEQQLLTKKVGIFLVCSNVRNFKKHLAYSFSFELLEKAEVKECFGGIMDISKLKFFDKMITNVIRNKAEEEQIPKSELLYDKMNSFAENFNAL